MPATASKVGLLVIDKNGEIVEQSLVNDLDCQDWGITSDGRLAHGNDNSQLMRHVRNGLIVYLSISDNDFFELSEEGWTRLERDADTAVRGLILYARKHPQNIP